MTCYFIHVFNEIHTYSSDEFRIIFEDNRTIIDELRCDIKIQCNN
jgi:hypothetical protein